jgi:hypothetical protein
MAKLCSMPYIRQMNQRTAQLQSTPGSLVPIHAPAAQSNPLPLLAGQQSHSLASPFKQLIKPNLTAWASLLTDPNSTTAPSPQSSTSAAVPVTHSTRLADSLLGLASALRVSCTICHGWSQISPTWRQYWAVHAAKSTSCCHQLCIGLSSIIHKNMQGCRHCPCACWQGHTPTACGSCVITARGSCCQSS